MRPKKVFDQAIGASLNFNKSYTVKKLSVINFRKTMKNKTRKKVYNGLRSGGTKSFYTSDLHTSVGGVQYKKQFLTQMKGRPAKICGWTRNPHWIVGTPMIRDLLMIDCLKYYSQVPKYETFLGEILGKKSHILASHRINRGKYGDYFFIQK